MNISESLKPYQDLFEPIHDGVFFIDFNGKIIDVNPFACQLFGYNHDELCRLHIQVLIDPDDLFKNPFQFQKLIQEKSIRKTRRLRRKDGSLFDAEIQGQKIFDSVILGLIRDISPHKTLQANLIHKEDLLEESQKLAHLGSYEIDLVNDSVFWSKETFRIFGLDPQGTPPTVEQYRDYLHPQDADLVFEHFEESIQTGKDFELSYRIVRPNGETRVVYSYGRTLKDSNQKVITLRGTIQDQTERIKAEKQLIKLTERLSLAADSAELGVWDWDLITQELIWDDWMHRLFGLEPGSFDEKIESWRASLHPEDAQAAIQAVEQALQGENDFDIEYRILHPDGSTHYIKAYGLVIRDSQKRPIRMTGVNFDITKQKQAELEREAALRTLREREHLLSKIFEILPVGLWIANKDGHLIQSNPMGRKIWGAEPLVGAEQYGVFKARRLPSGEELQPQDWALTRTIRDKATILDELLEIDAFDGVKRTILNYTAPVLNELGELENAVIVNLDITERTKMENALLESQQRFEQMFSEHDAVMLLIDPENQKILNANQAASRFYGYTLDQLRAMSVSDLNQLSPEKIKEELAAAVHKNQSYFIFPHKLASGEIRTVEVYSTKIQLNHHQVLYSIVHDITERKKAELKLQDQLEELRRWHAVTLDRESRVLALKKEVNQLLKQNGLPPRYASAEESPDE